MRDEKEGNEKLNDIKPSERKRALLLSKDEWNKFGTHLVRKQRAFEEREKEREEKEQRKLKSKEIAKTWDNTIMNIRRRRIEARREQISQIEKDRRKRFLEMRKEEMDEKKKIIEDAKMLLRLDKDNTKSLISALRFSEVLREREEQLKFNRKLRDIQETKEKEYAEKLKTDSENYKLELKKEREIEIQKKKELNIEVRREMKELIREKQEEEQTEKLLEIQDNMRVLEEIKSIQENERKEKERKKQLVMDDVKENRRLLEEYKEQCRLEEEEEEAAIQIHAATKKRIARIKKEREREQAIENQVKREKISQAVAAKAADKESEENRIIAKAIAEKKTRDDELYEKKAQYRQQLARELKEERIRQLKAEEVEKQKEKELLKLSIMQRQKNTEVNKEFTQMMFEKKRQLHENNRKMWSIQHEEKVAARISDKTDDINAVARAVECWNLEDKVFLDYATSVVEESKEKSRPLLPIIRYIEQFKKEIGLTARPKQHNIWKSRVPINNKIYECQQGNKQLEKQ